MDELEWGACHGWRAYDIAVFRWGRALNKQGEKLWEAFLEGYMQYRAIQPMDLAAVPLFVAMRQIWLLGMHTLNAADWG